MKTEPARRLIDLRGIGPRMLDDFDRLGVHSVAQLARRDPLRLYREMSRLAGERQDPCVFDTYRCAIEQARHPDLPGHQCDWWYWSRIRKSERLAL